jgi:hypothetical protein
MEILRLQGKLRDLETKYDNLFTKNVRIEEDRDSPKGQQETYLPQM